MASPAPIKPRGCLSWQEPAVEIVMEREKRSGRRLYLHPNSDTLLNSKATD